MRGPSQLAGCLRGVPLSNEEVVRSSVRVLDLSRRNQNLAIERASGPSLLLKRDPDSSEPAGRELTTLRLMHEYGGDAVAKRAPALIETDREMLIEFFPHTGTITSLLDEESTIPGALARELGAWLASLHRADALAEAAQRHFPAGELPWVLSLAQPTTALMRSLSGVTRELIEVVQQQPDLVESLSRLRSIWSREALIHNDLKWDNILLPQRHESGTRPFLVIDWELAGYGDPRWDVGSVFAAFLTTWVTSIPTARDADADSYAHLARRPLESLQPAIRAFWHGYVETSDASGVPGTGPARAESIMPFCAARLMQYAVERTQWQSQLSAGSILLVQIAQNVFRNSGGASTGLLGLDIPATRHI